MRSNFMHSWDASPIVTLNILSSGCMSVRDLCPGLIIFSVLHRPEKHLFAAQWSF